MARDMMRLRREVLNNTPHEETASGAVATFKTDIGKLKALSVAVEPVQNLNGYEAPWPPGGGKNLFEPFGGDTGGIYFTVQSDGTVKISGTASSTGWKSLNTGFLDLPYNGMSAGDEITIWSDTYLEIRLYDSNSTSLLSKASSGSNKQTLTIPAEAAKLRFYESANNGSIQSGDTVNKTAKFFVGKGSTFTAWTPYSNICPISGWSEAKVTGTGKNFAILSQQILDNDRTQNGITWKATSKSSFHVSGTATDSSFLTVGYGVTSPYLRFLKAGTYTVSCNFPANCSVYIYGFAIGSGATSTTTLVSGVRANSPRTFTITNDWMINIQALIASGVTIDDEINVQVEPGTTASVYDAYRGVTVTIDLNGTRYGGTVDFVSGTMRVTHEILALPKTGWQRFVYDNGSSFLYFSLRNFSTADRENFLCDVLKATGVVEKNSPPMLISLATTAGLVRCTPYETVAEWESFLANNDANIVYELATPFTVQLTPAQLRAIKGQNNIFADTGDVSVKYWKHGG